MNTTEARNIVRQFARNAGANSTVTDAEIDRAIMAAGGEFCRRTGYLRHSVALNLTAGSASLGGLPEDFAPQRLVGVYTDRELSCISYAELLRRQADAASNQQDAQALQAPTAVCVLGASDLRVHPLPRASSPGGATLIYLRPFESWTAGGAGPASFALADDVLYGVLIHGATSRLQMADPDCNSYTAAAAARFEQLIHDCMGASAGEGAGAGAQGYLMRRGR